MDGNSISKFFFQNGLTNPPYSNSISGVLQDLNPATSPAGYSFNYEILGTAPCRAFVVNIYKVASYSCNIPQTSQIVLYEGSNMIDIYIENRTACTGHNGGNGLVGIQNATGTVGFSQPLQIEIQEAGQQQTKLGDLLQMDLWLYHNLNGS